MIETIIEKIQTFIVTTILKRNKDITVDQEYNAIKEKSIESERKLNSLLQKITKLTQVLEEASKIQLDISYSFNELVGGNLQATQQVNSFHDCIREVLSQQEEYNHSLTQSLQIPLTEFLKQYKVLNRREKELSTRRKAMEKAKQSYTSCPSSNELEQKYSRMKHHYMKLRNEMINDRLLLLKIIPSLSLELVNQFVQEGWGCLVMKETVWKRIHEVFDTVDMHGIDSYCHLITDSVVSESYHTSNTRSNDQSTVFNARVVYNYQPKNEKELELKEGDWIHVLSTDGYWWEGEHDGKLGLFPSNYVVKDMNI